MKHKIKNLPKHIYLQIGEDCDDTDWNNIYPSYEVSWCAEKIYDNDIIYNLKAGRNTSVDNMKITEKIKEVIQEKKDNIKEAIEHDERYTRQCYESELEAIEDLLERLYQSGLIKK